MPTFCRPFCRPGDEPDPDHVCIVPRLVDSAEAAIQTILASAHDPAQSQVIAVLLDPDYIGHTVLVVDGTTSPDNVVEVMEHLAEAAAEAGREQVVVLASIRPDDGPLPGDVDRWIELSDLADTHGCELVEWFVIRDRVAWCPRDFLVEPPRWPEPTESTPDASW
jgi:hypothetical protein